MNLIIRSWTIFMFTSDGIKRDNPLTWSDQQWPTEYGLSRDGFLSQYFDVDLQVSWKNRQNENIYKGINETIVTRGKKRRRGKDIDGREREEDLRRKQWMTILISLVFSALFGTEHLWVKFDRYGMVLWSVMGLLFFFQSFFFLLFWWNFLLFFVIRCAPQKIFCFQMALEWTNRNGGPELVGCTGIETRGQVNKFKFAQLLLGFLCLISVTWLPERSPSIKRLQGLVSLSDSTENSGGGLKKILCCLCHCQCQLVHLFCFKNTFFFPPSDHSGAS